jgi:hypothetical protein
MPTFLDDGALQLGESWTDSCADDVLRAVGDNDWRDRVECPDDIAIEIREMSGYV